MEDRLTGRGAWELTRRSPCWSGCNADLSLFVSGVAEDAGREEGGLLAAGVARSWDTARGFRKGTGKA